MNAGQSMEGLRTIAIMMPATAELHIVDRERQPLIRVNVKHAYR